MSTDPAFLSFQFTHRKIMREAVIVSTARTGIGRAYKGSLNHTEITTAWQAHVIAESCEARRH
jgi:hypothetical protein